jgi:hypothetical protein
MPLLTEAKLPVGALAASHLLSPQQATEPSLFTPHVCPPPALTEVKLPAGGVARPWKSSPQQTTVPSLFTPQV